MSGLFNNDDGPPKRSREEEGSFAIWLLIGCGLVLAYILALALLRPTP
ncbi:MAG: hypothetical protein ACXU82_11160 [Caulobacteraceae bacterium]